MRRLFLLSGSALLALLAGALPAAAQVPSSAGPSGGDEPNPGVIAVPTVDVLGRATPTDGYQPLRSTVGVGSEARLLDIPQAVAIVPPSVIRDQAAFSLDEALANVSGIAQTNTLGQTQDAVIRRGFGDNRDGGILVDGLRTALPRVFNTTTDYVEVLKGPSSTLYGILDPGGLVNVVTRRPQLTASSALTGRLSSFGGGSTSFDTTGPIGTEGFAYRLVGEYQNQAYWRNFGNIRQSFIAPMLAWYGPETTIETSYWHSDYDVPFDRGTIYDTTNRRFVQTSRRTRLDEPYNVSHGSSDYGTIRLGQRFDQSWRMDVRYAYSVNNYSDNQARYVSYNGRTGILTRRADATDDSTIFNHAFRADLSGDVNILGFRNELLFGSSYDYVSTRRTDLIRGTRTQAFDISNPVYGLLPTSRNVVATDSDQTERVGTYSFYVQDSLHLSDQWILVGGARYQRYDQVAGRGRPFVRNTDVDGDRVTPRVGIVFQPRPDLAFFANYAQSFKPNSNISTAIGSQPPETGESWEVGVKAELLDGLSVTAAAFNIQKHNVIYRYQLTTGINVTAAAGRVRSSGFELDVAGRLTRNLSFIGSLALTDVDVVEDVTYKGRRPVNVPRTTASGFLTYSAGPVLGGENLSFGGGVRHEGRRAGDPDNTYFLPSYAVADAFVAYDFRIQNTALRAQVNVKNIFDRTYYTSSIGSSNLGIVYGEPLQAIGSLTARF